MFLARIAPLAIRLVSVPLQSPIKILILAPDLCNFSLRCQFEGPWCIPEFQKSTGECAFTAYIRSWGAPFRMMCPIECILSDRFTFPPCFCHEVMEKCSPVAEVTLHTYVKIATPPQSVVYMSSRSRPSAIADLALHAFFRQSAPVCRSKLWKAAVLPSPEGLQ